MDSDLLGDKSPYPYVQKIKFKENKEKRLIVSTVYTYMKQTEVKTHNEEMNIPTVVRVTTAQYNESMALQPSMHPTTTEPRTSRNRNGNEIIRYRPNFVLFRYIFMLE